jgi:DNA-binding transcriptional regulator GbsR (MarR family)
MDKKNLRSPEIEELSEQIGEFIRYWGFKKIHGKIWLQIYLAEEPLDAAGLIARLGISKALVSMSINDLLGYRVILPKGKSARGTQLYVANPDLMEAILGVLRARERKMLSRIQASYRQVKKSAVEGKKPIGVDPVKVKQLGELIDAAEDVLDAFLDFRQVDLSVWSRFLAPPAPETKAP